MIHFDYIDTDTSLKNACADICHCKTISMDTEFIIGKTYFAKLALLQIAAGKQTFLIDPLGISHPEPLLELLQNPAIEKIMHSPQQDKEVLTNTYRIEPQPIFDTQLAMAFLGEREQISYQALVAEKIGVQLDKLYTVSDWLKRPLQKKQLDYAAEDVIYLEELYGLLKEDLHKAGKLGWFEEESLLRHNKISNYVQQFIRSIEHSSAGVIFLYRKLMEWREEKAQTKNLPRQWVISNLGIKTIITHYQKKLQVPKKTIEYALTSKHQRSANVQYVQEIAHILSDIDPESLSFKRKINIPAYKKKLQTLMQAVAEVAKDTNITPTLIANKYSLMKIIVGKNGTHLGQWRQQLIENALKKAAR